MTEGERQVWIWHTFETRETLARALARDVAFRLLSYLAQEAGIRSYRSVEDLRSQLRQVRPEDLGKTGITAEIAVSGGTSPRLFLNELSQADLPWDHIVVTLCDERFVPPSSERSNEAMVRRELLRNRAAKAEFHPLYRDVATVEEAAKLVDRDVTYFAAVVLGMGLDGHIASIFPDAAELAEALDLNSEHDVIAIHAPSVPEPRLSHTLQALTAVENLYLHIEGEAKRDVFERAMRTDPPLPVRALVEATREVGGPPVEVYWAP